MTFEIVLTSRLNPSQSEGAICVEETRETFVASHAVWDPDQYRRQWEEAAERLVAGDPSCFVTDVAAPGASYIGERWNAWPERDLAVLQHQILTFEGSTFDVDNPYASLPPTPPTTSSAGLPPSTWHVPLAEVVEWQKALAQENRRRSRNKET